MQTLGLFLILLAVGLLGHSAAFALGVVLSGLPLWSPEIGAALAYRHD